MTDFAFKQLPNRSRYVYTKYKEMKKKNTLGKKRTVMHQAERAEKKTNAKE